jgi:DNA polymerase III subunit alpha
MSDQPTLDQKTKHQKDCACNTCKPKFAHLHQHTAYSLLDGAARIKDLMKWVKEVSPENPTVAMTDHGNMHGAVEFYKTAVGEGVKPIIGFEAYVTAGSRFEKKKASSKLDGGYFHLTLLAKNFKGYQNLCKLNSRGWLEGFYGKPRVDHELLKEYSEGVVALSGCLGAQIPRTLLDIGFEAGEEALKKYLELYGDNFFIELQDHGIDEQKRLNPMLKQLANKYGLGMVATNDGHYVRKEDARAHEALLAIQTKTVLSDPNRFKFPCDEFYVKTPNEMGAVIPEAEYPSALSNTMLVADLCDVTLPIGDKRVYQMPEMKIPAGRTLAEQLRIQTYEGLMHRYSVVDETFLRGYLKVALSNVDAKELAAMKLDDVLLALAKEAEKGRQPKEEGQTYPKYVYEHLEQFKQVSKNTEALTILERAEFELGVIAAMGFPDYFLIVADFINWAKDNGIAVGPGRGSGAGSIVAYATRITNIDPLAYELLFERFLNPERISMPDFDIDFSDVRRMEVVEYVREKYGEEKVSQIATFGTMASKAAIKDAARVLESSYADADAVSKLVPVVFGKARPIAKAMEEVPEIKQMYDNGASEFMDVAMALEGLTRHASVHAAGVIIAREPIQELAPVFRSGDGPIVCQYDMGSIEELGFLKMDFLGLRTLSFIEAAVRIIKQSRGIELNPDEFPIDDEKTFELLSRGEAAGVFQFESPGMVDTLRKLKPRRVQDLIAVSALYRPGPMENIPTYIRRHHGLEAVRFEEFPNAEKYLEPILRETYGIPVYQEQIMQIAQAVAGYTLGGADILRRAMGKKKVSEMEKQRKIFTEGAAQNGIPKDEANAIFDLLEKFANYGFNKCLVGETLVPDKHGNVGTIQELYLAKESTVGGNKGLQRGTEALEVITQDNFSVTTSKAVGIMQNGVKPVYKLITSLGKEITATGNHPFLTLDGWKNLEDLKLGDRIASPARLPMEGQRAWEQHKLVTLGWVLAEGNTCHPCGVYVYTNNQEMVDDVVTATKQFENTQPTVKQRTDRNDVFDIYLGTGKRDSASGGKSGARLWLESLGIVGQNATQKGFPRAVFTLRSEDIAVILGRYWSGDGFIAAEQNFTPYAATSSKNLAKQLQHLLLRFGIVSRVAEKTFAYREGRTGYTVHVVGRRSVENFLKHLAPHMVGREGQLECLRDYLAHTPANLESLDTLPPEVKFWVKAEKEKSGLPWNDIEERSGVCVKELYGDLKAHKKGFRRETIRKLAEFFDSDKLRQACSEDIFWESVVSIEYKGEEMTYDLEVSRTHNFVANDLIVHNSHSAAYGVLSYQTAYLKTHYPVEFAAALLTVERANSDKVAQYVNDARHLGIPVLSPDINESLSDFTPVGDVVRFGLYGIKNVGDAAVEHILEERNKRGKFKDIWDFCERIDMTTVNKRALEHLIKAGAFDQLGKRDVLLANLEPAMKWGAGTRAQAEQGQMGLFGIEDVKPPEMVKGESLTELQLLKMEKDALGLYISSHPMHSYPGLAEAASCTVEGLEAWYKEQIKDNFGGRIKVALAGLMQSVVKKPTKSGKMMARFVIADETGAREVVAFSRTYDEISPLLANDVPVVLICEPKQNGETFDLMADRLIRWDNRGQLPEVAVFEFDLSAINHLQLNELRSYLDEYTGIVPVHLKVNSEQGSVLYETEGVKIDKNRLEQLKESCPWLKAAVTIDMGRLLRDRGENPWQKKQASPPAASEVPF